MTRTPRIVLLLIFMLAGAACQSIRYDKPGTSGPLPAGAVTGRQTVRDEATKNPPRTMSCGEHYFQSVQMNHPGVECREGFNWIPLYDYAAAYAKEIAVAATPHCRPEECRPARSWIHRVRTQCLGDTASVIADIGVACLRAGTAPPPSQTPNPAELVGPERELPQPFPPDKALVGRVSGKIPTTTVSCNPNEFVLYEYREEAACGAAGFDYRAHVEYAQRRAPAVCGAISCAPGCDDLPVGAIGNTTWGCRAGGREVMVDVQVMCCMRRP